MDAEPERPLRVAMVGLRGIPASYGGIEKAVEALSVELVHRGVEVTVYTRTAYTPSRAAEYEGVRLRHLPQIDTKHLEAASHTALALLDAVRTRRFDVVHIHATGPALFSFIPRLAGLPTVVTVHALDFRREKWGPVASFALRLGLRVAATVPDQVITVSQELREHLRRSFGTEATYIPNGVDAADFAETEPVDGLDAGGFALFLGRLVPEKGVHTLLRAFARTDLDHTLAIAGPASHTGEYVREIEELAAADPRVVMLGPRYGAEKAWLLRNASVLVNPSTLEGMPIVLLEAAACGRPCVVSDIPEHLEVVRDGNGLLARTFPTGDEAGLADALAGAVRDPDREATGRPLHDLVTSRFRWSKIAEDTDRVYRRAWRGHRRSRRA